MSKRPLPKSGDIVIGKKPGWQIWAEQEMEKGKEYDRLIALGYVTVDMIARKTGWTPEKARKKLERACVKPWKHANEPELGKRVTMFLVPTVSKVSQH